MSGSYSNNKSSRGSSSSSGSGTSFKRIENRGCGQVFYSMPISPSLSQRLALYRIFKTPAGKATFEMCNRADHVELKKLIGGESGKKESASETIQIIAEYIGENAGTGKRGFMYKISFAPRANNRDNSLEVERLIYKNVINPLILERSTPYLVAFYGELQSKCHHQAFEKSLPTEKERNAFESFVDAIAESREYNTNQMNVLITERAYGAQVRNVKTITEKVFLEMLFQVLWTLLCFRDVGLSHNDLHYGNVFISELKEETQFLFGFSRDFIVVVNSNFMTQIFDFDFSSKVKTPFSKCEIFNTKLEQASRRTSTLCDKFGFCNSYNERRDITRFLTYLIAGSAERYNIRKWLAALDIINIDFVRSKLVGETVGRLGYAAWDGAICEVTQPDVQCQTFKEIEKYVKPLDVMFKKVVSRMREIGIAGVKKHDDVFRDDNLPCRFGNIYVLPSQHAEFKFDTCKTPQKVTSFGQDVCRMKMRGKK